MIHEIEYNNQRDNVTFGSFPGYKQCFTTCAWMLMSYYTQLIDAKSDNAMSMYFDDVEASVGKSGIGEIVKQRYNWIKGNTSYWYLVQQEGITTWLNRYGVSGHAVYVDSCPTKKLIDIVERGPVIVGTRKLGGLPGGHMILLIGYEDGVFIVNDPYGDATTHYKSKDGYMAEYNAGWLANYFDGGRCLFWSK